MSVNYPTERILAFLHREVPHMLPAKYKSNWPGGSGEEVIQMVSPYMGMMVIFNFKSKLF